MSKGVKLTKIRHEMFFSLLKSKLQKKQGLYYEDLNNNIKEVIKTIP
jgi:hypothetical protein